MYGSKIRALLSIHNTLLGEKAISKPNSYKVPVRFQTGARMKCEKILIKLQSISIRDYLLNVTAHVVKVSCNF